MTPHWRLLAKEFRALFPLWAACLLTICTRPFIAIGELEVLPVLAYAIGSVALGAHAIGHEYSYCTMSMLLTQPTDRRRLLMAKLVVLGVLLAALAAAAQPLIIAATEPRPDPAVAFLPFFGGLFVATWLTMVMRNQLAGAVFTITIAGMLFLISQLAFGDGVNGDHGELERFAAVARGLIGFSAGAAVLGWRAFTRLESIENGGTELHLPRWFRTPDTVRDANPVGLLIRKELRLQQMSFVLAAFYTIVWFALLARGYGATGVDAQRFSMVFGPVTLIYFWGLSLLIGALASAEERQMGMLDSQQLLPMTARRQWAIKASVAVGLAWLLAVVLPYVLMQLATRVNLAIQGEHPSLGTAALIVAVVTSCGLYVSSISSSGIRAVAFGFPFLLAASWLLGVVGRALARNGVTLRHYLYDMRVDQLALATAAVLFAALLLAFAADNHRSNERTVRRVLAQVGLAAAVIVLWLPLITFILVEI